MPRPHFGAWETLVKSRKYTSPHDVRADFGKADFLGGGKVVFNICGNKYRLVTIMLYRAGRVLIRHVVTHQDYDRLMASGTL